MNYETRVQPDRPEGVDVETLAGDETVIIDEGARSRRRRVVVAIVAIAAIAAIAFFFLRSGGDEAPKAPQLPAVSVIVPGRTDVQGTINATGSLAARVDMPVGVPGEGGQVVSVLVQPGQWVGQGQVLAVIDRSVQVQQQASQAAQIEAARANYNLAEANYQRALALVAKGFISKADLDRLRSTRDSAAAQVRVASAQLGVLRAQSARLNVVAPAAGLVLERRVEPGQVVSGGSGTLFRMARGGEMELLAQVSETSLASLSVGEAAKVVPVGSEKAFPGQIWQLSPVIDPQTRQGTARIALSYDPALRPGGFATATLTSGRITAPLLPESAIQNDDAGSFVYVMGKDDKVVRTPIKLGLVTPDGIVVAEGLRGTERIVLKAGGFLAPGDKVAPKLVKWAP